MAIVSRTEDFDTAWSLTMSIKRKGLADNYFNKSNALIWFKANAMKTEGGGKEIQEDIEYAGVTTEAFNGHDTLPTEEPDIVTTAYYPWCYYAAPIVIAFDTEQEARKQSNTVSVLEARTGNCMKSIRDHIETALFSAQSGKGMLGFQDIIATTPTSGTIGGINRATYSWWRNQYDATSITMTTQTVTGIWNAYSYITSMWNNCSDGTTEPEVVFTTLANYGTLQKIQASNTQVQTTPKDPKKGYFPGAPMVNNAPVLYSRACPSNYMYLVNSEVLTLNVQEGVNFSKTPFRSPHDQLSKVAYIVFSCQLTTNNPRRLGILSAIS